MSLTMVDYYKYAALATASYVRMGGQPLDGATFARIAANPELSSGGRIPLVLGEKLFVRTDANPDVWNILHYYGGDLPASQDPVAAADRSGFGATLFERNGEKVLALRGTEPFEDGGVDLLSAGIGQIGILGLALTQVVSLANCVLRLRAKQTERVAQVKVEATLFEPAEGPYVTLPGSVAGSSVYLKFRAAGLAQGLEKIEAGERVKLTGHSLGGHLAVMAARLFPDLFDPEVVVFNAAGYDPATANFVGLLESLPGIDASTLIKQRMALELGLAVLNLQTRANQRSAEALTALAVALGRGGELGGPTVVSVRSEDLAPGDDASLVASPYTGAEQYGVAVDLPTEENNHVIEPFMDALALQALLEPMRGPSFGTAELTRVLQASASQNARSYEGFTEALFRLFLKGERFLDERGNPAPRLPTSSEASVVHTGKGSIEARNAFHDALLRIQDAIKGKTGLELFSLADYSASDLSNISQGAQALGYRYALRELNPFVILGDNAIYAPHNAAGELALYDAASRTGTLTNNSSLGPYPPYPHGTRLESAP